MKFMKTLLVIINILLFISFPVLAQEAEDYTVYGSMPVGDIMQEIAENNQMINDIINDMIDKTNKITASAQKMANITCKGIEECECICQEIYTDNDCSCEAIECDPEYLCDNFKSEALMSEIDENFLNFKTAKIDFGTILSENKIVPKHLKTMYGGKFAELPKSHIYTDYNEFYLNYNQIISPMLANMGIISTLPSTNNKIPFIEYIKRHTDFTRIGFYNCQTPAGDIEDVEDISEGREQFKYPYRADFAMVNDIYLGTDDKENLLNYYCVNINYRYFPEN